MFLAKDRSETMYIFSKQFRTGSVHRKSTILLQGPLIIIGLSQIAQKLQIVITEQLCERKKAQNDQLHPGDLCDSGVVRSRCTYCCSENNCNYDRFDYHISY